MNSLWARIELLLARVQKPARYIGCEDGAATPRHAPGKVSWLLASPDTYEIGLPDQGLQILHAILNERDDAVAERTYAPSLMVARERNGHHAVVGMRAAIEDLSVTESESDSAVGDPRPHPCAVPATNGRGPRPTALVATLAPAFDPVDVTARVLRTQQWIERDGVRREIIPGAPGRDAHSSGVRMRRDFINGQQRTRLGGDIRCRRGSAAHGAARPVGCS